MHRMRTLLYDLIRSVPKYRHLIPDAKVYDFTDVLPLMPKRAHIKYIPPLRLPFERCFFEAKFAERGHSGYFGAVVEREAQPDGTERIDAWPLLLADTGNGGERRLLRCNEDGRSSIILFVSADGQILDVNRSEDLSDTDRFASAWALCYSVFYACAYALRTKGSPFVCDAVTPPTRLVTKRGRRGESCTAYTRIWLPRTSSGDAYCDDGGSPMFSVAGHPRSGCWCTSHTTGKKWWRVDTYVNPHISRRITQRRIVAPC